MEDIAWKREWFINFPLYPVTFWKSIENQRKFFHEIAAEFSIKSALDWKRITAALVRKKGGQVVIR